MTFIVWLIGLINGSWTLVRNLLGLRKEKPSPLNERVYTESEFLNMLTSLKKETVRVYEKTQYRFEWEVFLINVRIRNDKNYTLISMKFRFPDSKPDDIPDHSFDGTIAEKERERLKESVRMLKKHDELRIRGYFTLTYSEGDIYIDGIDRL